MVVVAAAVVVLLEGLMTSVGTQHMAFWSPKTGRPKH